MRSALRSFPQYVEDTTNINQDRILISNGYHICFVFFWGGRPLYWTASRKFALLVSVCHGHYSFPSMLWNCRKFSRNKFFYVSSPHSLFTKNPNVWRFSKCHYGKRKSTGGLKFVSEVTTLRKDLLDAPRPLLQLVLDVKRQYREARWC